MFCPYLAICVSVYQAKPDHSEELFSTCIKTISFFDELHVQLYMHYSHDFANINEISCHHSFRTAFTFYETNCTYKQIYIYILTFHASLDAPYF